MDIKDIIILLQCRLIMAYGNLDINRKYPATHERDRRIAYHEGARDALSGILQTLQEEKNNETRNQ